MYDSLSPKNFPASVGPHNAIQHSHYDVFIDIYIFLYEHITQNICLQTYKHTYVPFKFTKKLNNFNRSYRDAIRYSHSGGVE